MNRYVEITGDVDGLAALRIFMSVRALIRAKVVALQERDVPGKARMAADKYLATAHSFLVPTTARLVAIGGLSGTGKSSIARETAPALDPPPGALVLRSDVIRKRISGVSPTTRLPASAYNAQVSARVYATLNEHAALGLAAGHSVIVDAVFAAPEERNAIEALAADHPFTGIWLDATLGTRTSRVSSRLGDASDADAAIVAAQDGYDIGTLRWIRVPADEALPNVVAQVRTLCTRDRPTGQ
jgi:predicted kinase